MKGGGAIVGGHRPPTSSNITLGRCFVIFIAKLRELGTPVRCANDNTLFSLIGVHFKFRCLSISKMVTVWLCQMKVLLISNHNPKQKYICPYHFTVLIESTLP